MKRYEVYRHIRERALVFGLPLPFFALQILALIGSLMAVIFSFGPVLLFLALMGNGALYGLLLKLANEPDLLGRGRVFPKMISNKKSFDYEGFD